MELRDVFTALAVVVAIASLAVSVWNARRTTSREDARDSANVVLTYRHDTGEIVVLNNGPKPATEIALLATGDRLSLHPQNIGVLNAGEHWECRVTSPVDFRVFLSWRDSGSRVNRKLYRLVPGAAGHQGDGWPDIIRVLHPGVDRKSQLKLLRNLGVGRR